MTTTYTNITLIDVEPDEAAAWLAENGITAALSPAIDDITVVYENVLSDSADEDEPLEALLEAASEMSYELGCVAWLVIVDEDNVLIYTVYSDGEVIDSYGVRAGDAPEGGDAEILVDLFGAPKRQIKVVRAALQRELDPSRETASKRVAKVLTALDLPTMAVGYDYARITGGDTPPEFDIDDIVTVGNDETDA